MKTENILQEHKSIKAQVLVTCALVTCALVTAFGDETVIDELNPISLLAADSAQIDNEVVSTDIQIPLHTVLPDFGLSRTIAATAANFTAAVGVNLSQAGRPAAESKQVWKESVSPLPQNTSTRKTDELKNLINQIRSVRFESQPAAQHSPETATVKEPQPDENTLSAKTTKEEINKITDFPAIDNRTSEIGNRLEETLKDPNAIASPLELAEVLFQSGRPVPAGVCYKKALASLAANDPNVASERAWILFQIGNCFKNDDPNTAKESYAELIRTAPDSPWAQIAKSRHGLIEWQQQEQPRKIIEELKQ